MFSALAENILSHFDTKCKKYLVSATEINYQNILMIYQNIYILAGLHMPKANDSGTYLATVKSTAYKNQTRKLF